MDEHAQIGREARQLALPVAHHRGGADQQRGPRLRMIEPFVQQQRDHLNRFAQTHIVGQTRAQTPLPQKRQPRQPHRLIGPQLPAKIDRDEAPAASSRPRDNCRNRSFNQPSTATLLIGSPPIGVEVSTASDIRSASG